MVLAAIISSDRDGTSLLMHMLPETAASDEVYSPGRYAWLVVALLVPVALLNYLDRQMLAAMKSSVMGDIPSLSSDAQWGYMLGQFKWVYAVLSPFGGLLADRVSRRWTICGSLLAWSIVTWLTGQVTTYDGLLWTRTAMGISEAFYIPAALAMIADYHAGPTRSRAVGLHQMAIYAGMITGGFAGFIADQPQLGWRFAFDFTGLFGILYALPLAWALRDRPRAASIAKGSVSRSRLSTLQALLELARNVSFWLLVAYFTLPALAGWVIRDWMPVILKERYSIGQGMAGVSSTLYVNIAAMITAFWGGWLADRWMQSTSRGRIYVSAIGMALIVPALILVGWAPSLSIAIAGLTLFGIGWACFDGNNMPILAQIVRPDLRATGYGLMNFVSIGMGGFADWGFGELRDAQVPDWLIFSLFSGSALISVGLVLMIRPRSDQELQNLA
jgi:MFS transporter, Spinster family, sphingosine-1-phosphate transporter